ncbi:hypothetical protein [Syntrophotalea carbinolica]|nr:hypothetical protein [Syntrophotalea carbinolica]
MCLMDILAMVVNLHVKQRLQDGWRMLERHWHARRTEGRLQRLQRQVRRLEQRCLSLQK